MNMKVIGYVLALLGLGVLLVGAGSFEIPLISSINNWYINVAAMVLIALGVVLVIINGDEGGSGGGLFGNKYPGKRKSKVKGRIGDLPVYEGEHIVAYRRD